MKTMNDLRISIAATLVAIAGAIILGGCIPEPLEVDDIPKVKPQIVVSTQILPQQSLVVLLTKTIGALDASEDTDPEELLEQIAVDDALVTVTGPHGSYVLESLDNGVYGGVEIPFEPNQIFSLRIESASLGVVTAETTVKSLVTFEEIEADLYLNGFNDTLAQITYSLVDPIEKNYYMINVQEVERVDLLENALNPRAFTRLVDDKDFQNRQFSEQFKVFTRDFSAEDTIAVSLSNISAEYYEFMKLRIDNRFNLVEFLGEPVNYPTNVKGGKGFFNLYIPDVRFFILEE
jgi:hypothetical protein